MRNDSPALHAKLIQIKLPRLRLHSYDARAIESRPSRAAFDLSQGANSSQAYCYYGMAGSLARPMRYNWTHDNRSKKIVADAGALREDLLSLLEREQTRILRLCAGLEEIADSLPKSAYRERTRKLLPLLDRAFARHIFLHENCLFPILRQCSKSEGDIERILQQFEFEHAADHGLIHEIFENFSSFSSGKRPLDADMFGYLLRCFFDAYRRHATWESSVLYPLARQRLSAENWLGSEVPAFVADARPENEQRPGGPALQKDHTHTLGDPTQD